MKLVTLLVLGTKSVQFVVEDATANRLAENFNAFSGRLAGCGAEFVEACDAAPVDYATVVREISDVADQARNDAAKLAATLDAAPDAD